MTSSRRKVGDRMFAYPMLVTSITVSTSRLDRLGVVPGGRIAEPIWIHSRRPLTRAQRTETNWTLRSLTR